MNKTVASDAFLTENNYASKALYEYAPEYSNNVEIGSKNVFWKNRLCVNMAAFYTKVNDIQVPTLVLPEGITVTRNAGELISFGFAVEASFAPARGLLIEVASGVTARTFEVMFWGRNLGDLCHWGVTLRKSF